MIREKEYEKRRKALAKRLKPHSVAIVTAAKEQTRSHDTTYPYRQKSDFYYLSGIVETNAALVIVKKKKKSRFFLFVQRKDPQKELWEGKRTGVKKARKRYRVDNVYSIDSLQKRLQKLCKNKTRLYYDFSNVDSATQTALEVAKDATTRKDVAQEIHKLRSIKSKAEIALIEKSIAIAKKAHHQAMRLQKAGMYEYSLQAEIEYIFRKNGAEYPAYTTIVAGGDNANTLHYVKNDQKLSDGELVLIDAGCEYRYYASDITRTIPVNGKFTKPQKELYALVLHAQKKVIKAIKAGQKRSTLQVLAEKILLKGLIRLKILRGSYKKLWKEKAHKKFFPHGIGHFMGIDVHDQNPYFTYKGKKKEIVLRAGMVLTIEPGLYIPKEDTSVPKRYRGIGIRIEDDILVKKRKARNLSKGIAKSIKAIQKRSSL